MTMRPKNKIRQNTVCLEQQVYASQRKFDTSAGCDGLECLGAAGGGGQYAGDSQASPGAAVGELGLGQGQQQLLPQP